VALTTVHTDAHNTKHKANKREVIV